MKGENKMSKLNGFINNVSGKNVKGAKAVFDAANKKYLTNATRQMAGKISEEELFTHLIPKMKAEKALKAARGAQTKARLATGAGVGAVGAAGLGLSGRDKTASEIVEDAFEKIY